MRGKRRCLGLLLALALVSSALFAAAPPTPLIGGCQGEPICKICGCSRCPTCPLCCSDPFSS
jgi:hypothetical protein